MGITKRHMEDIEVRGYGDAVGMVRSVCIVEPALVEAIGAEGEQTECEYCGLVPDAPNATVELERVVQLIVEGIQYEYEDPAEGAAWDGREGGFLPNSAMADAGSVSTESRLELYPMTVTLVSAPL